MNLIFALMFIGVALISLWGLINFKSVLKKYKEIECIKFSSQGRNTYSEMWIKLMIRSGLILLIMWGLIGGLVIIFGGTF